MVLVVGVDVMGYFYYYLCIIIIVIIVLLLLYYYIIILQLFYYYYVRKMNRNRFVTENYRVTSCSGVILGGSYLETVYIEILS